MCFQQVRRSSNGSNFQLWDLLPDFMAKSKKFFTLSAPEKKVVALHPCLSLRHRYSTIGNEKGRDRICMKENFDWGNPEDRKQCNRWPLEELLPGFRSLMEGFYKVKIVRCFVYLEVDARSRIVMCLYTSCLIVCLWP